MNVFFVNKKTIFTSVISIHANTKNPMGLPTGAETTSLPSAGITARQPFGFWVVVG